MKLTALVINKAKLTEYMHQHDYSKHYIERHVQMSNSIIKQSEKQGWHSFSDVIKWHQNQNHTTSYMADVRKILTNLEFFSQHECFPGNGIVKRELLYQCKSLGKLDMTYLQDHIDELLHFMKDNDYSKDYIRNLRFISNRIIILSRNIRWDSYAEIFNWYQSQNIKSSYMQNIRAFLGILEEFHIQGTMPNNRKTQNVLCSRVNSYSKLISPFRKLVDSFIVLNEEKGLCKSTVNSYVVAISCFFLSMQNDGAQSLEQISRERILAYFNQANVLAKGHGNSVKIRHFFQICIPQDVECSRIWKEIPQKHSHRKNIQYITTEEEESLRNALKNMDNGLSLKTRAIGNILFYTGIRSSDVIALTLNSIDLYNKTISFIQKKTGSPLVLPLPTVVGNAIYDYCALERPVTKSENLFVGNSAPHHAVGTGAVNFAVSSIFQVAGIRQEKGDRKGSHIFRHRAATTMMKNNVSPAVISVTLGHSSPKSLNAYLYADTVHLRECAISLSQIPLREEVFQYV